MKGFTYVDTYVDTYVLMVYYGSRIGSTALSTEERGPVEASQSMWSLLLMTHPTTLLRTLTVIELREPPAH